MGKDLAPSIIRFLEERLTFHSKVKSFEMIDDNEYFIYHIKRKNDMRDLYLLLSDDYYFGDFAIIINHPLLKDGGFILIAKPEATDYSENNFNKKLGIGKIGKLLGALNKDKFWTYEKII